MSIEIPMDLELMWIKEQLVERDNQIFGLVAEKTKLQEQLTLRGHFAGLAIQELSFQQDLNQHQLLAFINNGFEEIKNKYEPEAAQASFNWDKAPVICELNGYRWHLGQETYEELNWNDAIEWCQSVGGGLPPRDILLQCYMNEDIKSLFKTEWYWSSTEFDTSDAWVQYFFNGNQDTYTKTNKTCVRAVKKVRI